MISEVKKLIMDYQNWLKDKTKLRQIDNSIEITTPYLDRHNDYIQIYIQKDNGNFILTDDGYTINDLKRSGCDLNSQKRTDILNLTLNGFGIKVKGDELITNANVENFALKKHSLVQAILSVNDIFFLAQPLVRSLFLEDVTKWLDLNEVRYLPSVQFAGKTGYVHTFDFGIPQSRKAPERIVKVINRPNKDNAQSIAFAWLDTREMRKADSKAYAFLNDAEGSQISAVEEALKVYNINPIIWTQREKYKDELVA